MIEYTFNKPGIHYLEMLNSLLQDLNLYPYNFVYSENILTFEYEQELTIEEYNTLNTFITNYIPPTSKPDIFYNAFNIQIVEKIINNNDWCLIGTCHYVPNTEESIDLVNITFISNIDVGDYQIRCYNYTNNTVIGVSSVLNNNQRQVNTIEINTNNRPTTDCIIELHAKISNINSKFYIDSGQLNLYIKDD